MANSSPVSPFCIEPSGSSASMLEEGRRVRGSHLALPPLESSPGHIRSALSKADTERAGDGVATETGSVTPPCSPCKGLLAKARDDTLSPSGLIRQGSANEPSPTELLSERGTLTDVSGASPGLTPSKRLAGAVNGKRNGVWLHTEGVPKMVGEDSNRFDPESNDRAQAALDDEEGKEDESGAQRLFIGWVQRRQRECVILISLGCMTVLLVEQLREGNGSVGLAVTLIPVTVHLLLVWDIWQKWDRCRRERNARKLPASQYYKEIEDDPDGKLMFIIGGETQVQRLQLDPGRADQLCVQDGELLNRRDLESDRREDVACRQELDGGGSVCGSADVHRIVSSTLSLGSISESNSSTPSSELDRGSFPLDRGEDSDMAGGCGGGGGGNASEGGRQEEGRLSILETPFQKCIKLLQSSSAAVTDPTVRKQLHKVERLLADPDSLHVVKHRSIRHLTTDVKTLSYIENVLQTRVKGSSSADRSWQKLRNGMYVVRTMAKDAAGGEAECDDGKDTVNASRDDLDELLKDFARGGGESLSGSRRTSGAVDFKGWDNDDTEVATLEQLNGALVQRQQLVTKIISRPDLRKDPDRMTVREMRDLLRDSGVMDNVAERVAGEEVAAVEEAPRRMSRCTPCLPHLNEACTDAVAALMQDDRFLSWDFNVFDLEEKSGGHALWFTAMSALAHYNLIGAFGLSFERLSQFFLRVEATYCYEPDQPNSYHTHVHAADVTLTVAHFMSVDIVSRMVRSTHGLALLMAAIMHDYRHPGVNNGFLVRELNPLAVTYNDASVLENFHAAEGFKLMLDRKFDIFETWKPEDIKFFRAAFLKCILATDLALSMEYTSKFQRFTANLLKDKTVAGGDAAGSSGGGLTRRTSSAKMVMKEGVQTQILLLQMVLKVADVAHPCKPWKIHCKWSDLVTEEFFRQGDKEFAQGLPLSPLCDRREKNLPKSQCDFIDFIVRPCVTIFSSYCQVSTWSDHMDSNFRRWKSLQEEQAGVGQTPPIVGRRHSKADSLDAA